MLSLLIAFAAEAVSISGTMPDEATRAALVARLRSQFVEVRDDTSSGKVSMPASWDQQMQRLLGPHLKLVHKGTLTVEGYRVSIAGEVASEAQRQQVLSELSAALSPNYTVSHKLRVVAGEQAVLDAALAERIVEFESGKASLTEPGRRLLDQMAEALLKVKGKRVAIIGHTDNAGARAGNLALSHARAMAVRDYVVAKGVDPASISVSGEGPDRPVADNATPDGRARNRRIEFHVL
ncbi:OmpA family protein [Massilia sp. TS11]|uniref:OmpA family protein n=1 Tax=Massilia sp. TS11 TaxID=2908003 RepID=UPI001EDB6D47|nr:OmpA family protein [Massilia sp. TS11]MCG2584205.1 OmpA family protein [Massilia sp. TS11]